MPVIPAKWLEELWLDQPLRRKAAAIVAIPLVCLLVQSAWLLRVHDEEQAASALALHTQEVQLTGNQMLSFLVDSETGVRGYALTGERAFLAPYERAVEHLPEVLRRLQQLTADNPEQSRRVGKMAQLSEAKIEIDRAIIRSHEEEGPMSPLALDGVRQGKRIMDEFRAAASDFERTEDQLLTQRSAALTLHWQEVMVVLWGGLLAGILAAALARSLFKFGISNRLEELSLRADIFAGGSLPPLKHYARDEIGNLGERLYRAYAIASVNASKLRESEQQQKEQNLALAAANSELEAFSYSVSHDLRAPLRHIDGFSRILAEDYGQDLPSEAHRLLERVRNGAAKMGQLMDELLQLGRLSRKEISLQSVDLGKLLEEARVLVLPEIQGRHVIWRAGALPEAECDPELMRQVFANLLSNAIKYTRLTPVAVIEVGMTEISGEAALVVRDNGVGFSMK